MSASHPHVVPDEAEDYDSDYELLDFDTGSSEPEIIAVNSRATSSRPSSAGSNGTQSRARKPLQNDSINPPDALIQRYKLGKGNVVKPGDTVELRDHSRERDTMHSGDFLRIKSIVMNMETDEVRLRGHRLRRTKYLGQIFDWKFNELAMVLRVDEHDTRSPFVAGMEDVGASEVVFVRECTLTNKNYPFMSFRMDGGAAYPRGMSQEETKRQIFHGGRLTCRVVAMFHLNKNGKPYGGIVRHLYAAEADPVEDADSTPRSGLSRETFISVEDNDEDDCVIVSNKGKRRQRSESIEMLETEPTKKRRSPRPTKKGQLVFGDVFCGAGGASQGAQQAGYYVKWGLDEWDRALETYRLNHPTAHTYLQNAHDFDPDGVGKEYLRVDVLHLSPPCCYFSPAHTRDGPKDQANMEAIFTVGPILSKIKPRVATLEQTFGLATHEQHNKNFLMLLHDIGKAGYDVRYKIQDLSEYGLVQKRKRLIMIAARRGTPLPPLPRPTHGPPGSGLTPYVYIAQALTPITRQGARAMNDPYHLPKPMSQPKPAYDPNSFLKGCITTGGTDAYHPSGKRRFTPRELSLFQSFKYTYHFAGTKSDATTQIGNAFPPVMAEKVYRTIAKTLEAFDTGLIGAEDDLSILDLDALLERNGSRTPQARSAPSSYMDGTSRSRDLPIRSIERNSPSSSRRVSSTSSSSSSGKNRGERSTLSARTERAFPSMDPMGGVLDGISGFGTSARPSASRKPQGSALRNGKREVIEISDDSDEDEQM